MKTVGVILAGGEGRRLGGGKPLRLLAGRPLIEHAIDRLRPQVDALWLSGPDGNAAFERFGLRMVADAAGGPTHAGPLAGIVSSLEAAAGFDLAAFAPCDMPFLPLDLVARLSNILSESPSAAGIVLSAHGRLHPTVGLWRPAAFSRLSSFFAEGGRALHEAARFAGAATFDAERAGWPDTAAFNVNSMEDLEEAEARMAEP
jgi:molybdopterin-guanine dinucleotide biosynthesis protein A